MCGHGTIGLIATLSYMGRIAPGEHRVETPVGTVTAVLHPDGEVTVNNVPSYRSAAGVRSTCPVSAKFAAMLPGEETGFSLSRIPVWKLRSAMSSPLLRLPGRCGRRFERTVSLERTGRRSTISKFSGHPQLPGVDCKNFVLCPGKAYDRSPCGTGTSAKLACLYADGKLREGQIWKQESIVGSIFEGSVTVRDGQIYPSIKGSAFVNAEAELVLDPRDPFCMGIRS